MMKKYTAVLLVGLLLGATMYSGAQSVSTGGTFQPLEDYVVAGVWTFRGASPIKFEGGAASADDGFELTLAVPNVTADTTLTLPTFGSAAAAFLFSTLATNDLDVANSIWGVSNGLRLEGATADAFETTLSPTNVGGDITLTLPGLGNASGAILASTLTTNDLGVANSVWGVSNGLTFEGATGDAGELFLTVADIATASRTMTLPDMGAASAVLASGLTTNTLGAANSIWGVSNGLTFEGATADAGELFLTVADIATASRTMTLPDMGAASAVLASTLTTNTVGAANSVWGISNSLVFEGATADGSELTMTLADPTAAITISWANDLAGTYRPLTNIAADVTGGVWVIPEVGAVDVDLTMTDNTLYVYRLYLNHWQTVANIYITATQGADIAGSDDLIGVAIYEDADAGTQLLEAISTDFAATGNQILNNTDATLGPGFYRVAVCSGDGSGIVNVAQTLDDEYIDVVNQGAVVIGTAANACVAGDPPTTTGALSTADINMPILKFGP